ncbi:MAG: hypothetical protein ACTSVI_03330 [Promethearchaeota archaeon]
MNIEEIDIHIVITGSRQTGISSFINKESNDFEPNDEIGLGVDIQSASVDLENGKIANMIFYEIAGTYPLDALRKIFKKKNVALAIMFDLSNMVSLELAEVLFNRIEEKLEAKLMPRIKFLLGSHLDLERAVESKQIDALLTVMGEKTYYYEFSAETGENLNSTLKEMAIKILNQ